MCLAFIIHQYLRNLKINSLNNARSSKLTRTPTIFNLTINTYLPNTLGDYMGDFKVISEVDEVEHSLGNGWVLRCLSP